MKALVTGGSRHLAKYVVKELEGKYELVLFSRSRPPGDRVHLAWIQGDLNNYTDCQRAVEGVQAIQSETLYEGWGTVSRLSSSTTTVPCLTSALVEQQYLLTISATSSSSGGGKTKVARSRKTGPAGGNQGAGK